MLFSSVAEQQKRLSDRIGKMQIIIEAMGSVPWKR